MIKLDQYIRFRNLIVIIESGALVYVTANGVKIKFTSGQKQV